MKVLVHTAGIRVLWKMVAASLVLFGLAYGLTLFGKITILNVLLWVVLVVATTHLIVWLDRRRSTPSELRELEYVYIVIGLLGALGVMEVQSTLLQSKVNKVLAGFADYKPAMDGMDYCAKRGMRNRDHDVEVRCAAERAIKSIYREYDHAQAKDFIERYKDTATPEVKEIVKQARKIYSAMDSEIFKFIFDPKSETWLLIKIFSFYVVLIGVAVKVAKTTAEIRGWDSVSQSGSSATGWADPVL